jgi:hypothetical protein
MFRRQQIDPEPTPDPTPPSAPARHAAISDAAWTAQDRLRLGLGEVLRTSAEIVRWASERVSWALRRSVIWRAEDRAGTLDGPLRAISFGAVILLAAGAGVAGLVWATPDGPHSPAAAETALVTAPPPVQPKAAPKAPAAPTLHGAAPVFRPAGAHGAASQFDAAKVIANSSPKGSEPAASKASAGTASTSSAKSPAINGPPAGPAAVAVARDFASAFVLYETGRGGGEVRTAFDKTATAELSRSLLRRPPRLPANVTVPQAKVVNVVAGPSHGQVYTVSVSLLRVGLTSELRLEMENLKGKRWRVTNVLG